MKIIHYLLLFCVVVSDFAIAANEIPADPSAPASGIKISGFVADHCIDCGNVLVGSVRIEHGKIRWSGTQSASLITLIGGSTEFGITGSFLKDQPSSFATSSSVPNSWIYTNRLEVSIYNAAANGNAPSTGIFFAPSSAKSYKAEFKYNVYQGQFSDSHVRNPAGIGIADDQNALQVMVKANDQEVTTTPFNLGAKTTTFEITPKVDAKLLNSSVAIPSYALVELIVSEKDNDCTTKGLQFSESMSKAPQFQTDDYFHPLSGDSNRCQQRAYRFISSIGKPFAIVAQNNRPTVTSGTIQYDFLIRGHYNSRKTIILQNDTTIVTPTTKTLKITVTGNGTVLSKNPTINCSGTSSSAQNTGTCSANVPEGTTGILLQATPNTNVKWDTTACPNGQVTMTSDPTICTVEFKEKAPSTTAPQITISENLLQQPPAGNPQQVVIQGTTTPTGADCTDSNGTALPSACSTNPSTNQKSGARASTNSAAAATLTVTFKSTDVKKVRLKSGETTLREIPVNVTSLNSGIKIEFPTQENVTWTSNQDGTLTLDASKVTTTSTSIQPTLKTFDAGGNEGTSYSLGNIEFTVTKEIKACIDPIQTFVFPIVLTTNCLTNANITRLWKLVYDDSPERSFTDQTGTQLNVTKPGLVNLLLLENQKSFIDVYSWSSSFSSLSAEFDAKVNAKTIILSAKTTVASKYAWWLDDTHQTDFAIQNPKIDTKDIQGDQRIVTLQVTDPNGVKSSVAKIVKTVAQQSPEIKSITPTPNDNLANGFSVLLTATACDPDNLDETGKDQCSGGNYGGISSYKWQIEDEAAVKLGAKITVDNQPTARLDFGTATSINVYLTIQDDDNVSVSKNLTLTKPVANFTVNQNAEKVELDGSIARGLVINHSSDTGKIDGFHYHWSITPSACPDNSASERTKCTLSPGIYKVKLQITDIGGFQATSEEKEVFVGLPLKTAGKTVFAVNNTGTPLEITDGWFHSGVIADNGTFIPPSIDGTIQVKKGQPVTIRTTIGIPNQYRDKTGTVLIVLGTSGNFMAVNNNCPAGGKTTSYSYPEIKLDGTDRNWVNTLVTNCYQQVDPLSLVQDVSYPETFMGGVGIYDIYIGIESLNNIFYSPVPLKVEVVE